MEQMIDRFIHNLGIKQPITEMHTGTPVLQILSRCCLHIIAKALAVLYITWVVKSVAESYDYSSKANVNEY